MNLTELPGKLVVIGGGYIGTELGSAFANLGSEVTIIEGSNDILAGFEKQMTQIVKKGLKKKGVEIVLKASAKGVEETETGVTVTYEVGGEEKKVEADYVLVTVGRRPNTDEIGLEEMGIKFATAELLKLISNAAQAFLISMQSVILHRDHNLLIKLLMKQKLLLKRFLDRNQKSIT